MSKMTFTMEAYLINGSWYCGSIVELPTINQTIAEATLELKKMLMSAPPLDKEKE